MKKDEATLIANNLPKASVEVVKFLDQNTHSEDELKELWPRWGLIRKALNRRELIKETRNGVSLNARGKKVLREL